MSKDSNYYSKLFPQSIYRKSKDSDPKKTPGHQIKTDLPNLSDSSTAIKDGLKTLILSLNKQVMTAVLSDHLHTQKSKYLSDIFSKLGLLKKSTSKKRSGSVKSIWKTLEISVLNNIKLSILQLFSNDILSHFSMKISYIVKQYTRFLPVHVADSEVDDLNTIAQLEFIETFKSWTPQKNADIWPLAYQRINGAMKDHIRYVTKSDPSRFYDWVTDAGYLYLSQNKEFEFESRIETGVQLGEAMDSLSIRERKVVILYTQKDMTFSEISIQYNLSESQVSRIYKKAIEKIKKVIEKPTQKDSASPQKPTKKTSSL